MNVCVVGHGMMGGWHSDALAETDCVLHTLVGRREEPTAEFAQAHGFARWTTSLDEALQDEQIDAVIVANPSELHAETALAALRCGKHVLVEIPIALTLADAERVVAEAAKRDLTLGVVHPLRARPELIALRERIVARGEDLHHVAGRLFLHRVENIGAAGYQRSWTDNVLWHHMAHLVDAGLWLSGSADVEAHGIMSPIDDATAIPMDIAILARMDGWRSLVCTGSYYAREKMFDLLVVTDRDSYRLDVFASTLTTGAGPSAIASEERACWLVTHDFVAAVAQGREPTITGASILPTMRVLAGIQEQWDDTYGEHSLPGRPLHVAGSPTPQARLS